MDANLDLVAEIRRFSSEHPQGWGHDEWFGLLHTLSEEGHDIGDGDAIGLALWAPASQGPCSGGCSPYVAVINTLS